MSLLFFKVFLNNLYFVTFSLAQKKINAKIYFDKFRFEKLISLRNREKNAAQKIKKVKFALSAKSSFPLWKFENSFYVCKNFCMKKHNYLIERIAQNIESQIKSRMKDDSVDELLKSIIDSHEFRFNLACSKKEIEEIKREIVRAVVRKLIK